jgi:hypothetical protein
MSIGYAQTLLFFMHIIEEWPSYFSRFISFLPTHAPSKHTHTEMGEGRKERKKEEGRKEGRREKERGKEEKGRKIFEEGTVIFLNRNHGHLYIHQYY